MLLLILIVGVVLLLVMLVTLAWAIGTRVDLLLLKQIIETHRVRIEILESWHNMTAKIRLNEKVEILKESVVTGHKEILHLINVIDVLNRRTGKLQEELDEHKSKPVRKSRPKKPSNKKA